MAIVVVMFVVISCVPGKRRHYGPILHWLRAGDEDRYLVAADDEFLALSQDPDLRALRPVLDRNIDRKGPWFLAYLDK
jgi:hypothetical protein